MRLTGLFVWPAVAFAAAGPSFLLETENTAPYTPTYIGNGQIGLSSSILGTLPADCFVSGVYDHANGDVPRIARIPAWNAVDVHDGNAWLNQTAADGLRSYRQTLDMYDGVLRTQYEWPDGNRTAGVRIETFASRAEAGLAAVRLEFTPHFNGPVRVSLPLRAWPPPHRYPLERLHKLTGEAAKDQQAIWYPGHMAPRESHARAQSAGGLLEMLSQAEGSGTGLAEAIALGWPQDLDSPRFETSPQNDAVEVRFEARAGHTYVFYKFAVILPAFHGERLLSAAATQAGDAARRGYDALRSASANAWHDLWRSDILVEGDPALQTAVHSMLFYVLASARAGSNFSLPPMGLSSAGYYGHIFWDADTYMLPPLLLLHPDIARTIVMFRSRTLDAARANARRNGYQGAMYPWEAGPDGAETTPRFAYQNALYENHVNGDIALAAWQYYLATGDRAWLAQVGFPILRDTARFWTTRVTYNRQKDRYEIGKVVSVNESLIGVHNDPYTNAAAKKNLELAATAARVLGQPADPKWEEIGRKLYLPDVKMMLIDYPLEFPLSAEQRRAIARASLAGPQRGAMMGSEFEAILGVELGDKKLIDQLLPRTWRPYVRPPFNVLPETPDNNNINFITGAGAFLQQFLFGYSGLRLTENGLEKRVSPLLPGSVRKLTLREITVRGKRRTYTIVDGGIE